METLLADSDQHSKTVDDFIIFTCTNIRNNCSFIQLFEQSFQVELEFLYIFKQLFKHSFPVELEFFYAFSDVIQGSEKNQSIKIFESKLNIKPCISYFHFTYLCVNFFAGAWFNVSGYHLLLQKKILVISIWFKLLHV